MEQQILLIEPPFYRFKGANSELFPIGLGYIASLLHKNGFIVHIYNAEQFSEQETTSVMSYQDLMKNHDNFIKGLEDPSHLIWHEVKQYIEKYKPTIVGMGVNTTKLKSALTIAQIAKKIDTSIKIVMGGLHPTLMRDEVLQSEYVDYVVCGEGEFTFLELVDTLDGAKDLIQIKGISYKTQKGIIHNEKREFLENLDLLPFPNKSLIIDEQRKKSVYQLIMCSRGCPYRCGYCNSTNIWGRKPRFHSTNAVLKEIKKMIKSENLQHLQFLDDTFTYNKQWVIELCNKIISENIKINWSCLTRVDKLDESLLLLMKTAGCESIALGVESGSQRILDIVKKDITLKQIDEAQRLMNKVNLPWDAFIMVGLPYETKEDMYATLSLMKKLTCRNIILSIFTPYPGTEIYYFLEQQGLISKKWEKFSHQSTENYFNVNINPQEYQQILQEFIKITDRKNIHFFDLWNKAWRKKEYFLQNPKEGARKMLKIVKSIF